MSDKFTGDGSCFKGQRILLAHSNRGDHMRGWHARRELAARRLGFDLSTFNMEDLHPYITFPKLDRRWRRRDPALMRLYEVLGEKIAACDVFIHFNGVLIHPEFLAQFSQLKIYHCADDPDASAVVSQPVAPAYDICAIANPACLDLYRSWGCRQVIFWPLGAFHFDDDAAVEEVGQGAPRELPLVFVGSKLGASNSRYLTRLPLLRRMSWLYPKKGFFERIEAAFPDIHAYGGGWARGRIADDGVSRLYRQAQVGLNVHNSLGPINGRLYDLAAFGVCQVCDNKPTLHHVFEEGREIIGFESVGECIERIRHCLAHPDEARAIGEAARRRYLRDYTMERLWLRFFDDIAAVRGPPSA